MAKEYIEKWDVVSKLTDIENKCQKFKPFSEAEHEMYRMICETEIGIGKTPAADVVEVKHGRWVNKGGYLVWCSECNKHNETKKTPYCPNCGADMRGAEDE